MAYDKSEIKNNLTNEDIFELLSEWGGLPEYASFGIISSTICHNHAEEGSHKLYYYSDSKLFYCFTGCENPSFDIFELVMKVNKIQNGFDWDLNTAIQFIANRFGILDNDNKDKGLPQLEDWKYLLNYNRIKEISTQKFDIILKEYDNSILSRFNYSAKIEPWLKEGIAEDALHLANIGFYPGGDQITIPHYDTNGRFIGLRGRSLCKAEAERFGKYHPIKVNNILYSHPLGMNLYGLNWAKKSIKILNKAIVFESEKSVL